MNINDKKIHLMEIAENLIKRRDFTNKKISIKHIEIKGDKNIIVKIFLAKEPAVSIDDCSMFHKEYMLLLKIENLWDENINIEVSSPGVSE